MRPQDFAPGDRFMLTGKAWKNERFEVVTVHDDRIRARSLDQKGLSPMTIEAFQLGIYGREPLKQGETGCDSRIKILKPDQSS